MARLLEMTIVDESNSGSRHSRRGFLKRAGVGAGAVAASASGGVGAAFAPRAQAARSRAVATSPTTFGRLVPDLIAFAPATQRVKDALSALGARWQTFFAFGDGEVKPNKRIDTKISTPLFDLPLGAIASHDTPQSLPQRNLLRQLTWSLPSGQDLAKAMGVEKLTPEELRD
jgi:hypothetical protein